MNKAKSTLDHLFRQESGKMVSVLVNIFGSENFELAEDVVQSALLKALEVWKFNGVPENPKAWLYKVAKNKAIDIIRKKRHSVNFDFSDPSKELLRSEYTFTSSIKKFWEEKEIKNDFIGMMFACCHPDISPDNQITFILKILCGFSTKEIAQAFLTNEDVISKRIYRTKNFFRKNNIKPKIPDKNDIGKKINAVVCAIYLVFNEGYFSTRSDNLVRKDLIAQAMYLTKQLLENENTQLPEVYALMALMCFHAARTDSRTSDDGNVILLPDQDRTKWDAELINAGTEYLNLSAEGSTISNYHFEALIAYQHCIVNDYKKTDWKTILGIYEQMLKISFDPVIYLNMCLVILELEGAQAAYDKLQKLSDNKQMQKYELYYASLGEIYKRLKLDQEAIAALEKAKKLSSSSHSKLILQQKIETLLSA